MLRHAPRIAAGCMVSEIGFLEQLLVNLTIRVPGQPAQEREPSRRRPRLQGPGDADCRWILDVLPARWASDLCQWACYDLRDEW